MKVSLDLRSPDGSVAAFWVSLLHRCPTFVKCHSVIVDSPLVTGEQDTIRAVMKFADKVCRKRER